MPIYYDPETGEYFRGNGNRVVEVKRMGDLKTGGDPMDDGMDPMDDEMTMDDEGMPTKKESTGKDKAPPRKEKK